MERLNQPRFFQSLECTVLVDSFQTSCRDSYAHALFKFRNKNALCLEIDVSASATRRVELSSTSTVRITASDD